MTNVHTISDTDFAALASGLGGADAVRVLWSGQHSKRLLLLRALIESWPEDLQDLHEAVAAIGAAEAQAPTAVRAILVDPLTGAWSAETLRRLRRGSATENDLGHFFALATATALRARTDVRVHGYVRDGWLYLPVLGRVPTEAGHGRVELATREGRLLVDGVDVSDGRQSRRTLTIPGDPALSVELDDVDPYRDAYHVAAADRLTDHDVGDWRRGLAGAWEILTRFVPARAGEIREGLQCLVPLTKPDLRAARSATSREAVGVIGMDRPRTSAEFAVALVHEFQHSKLSAVLDLVTLYEQSDRTFFAPWRADPRPIGGLLQGAYAFLGVADLWRSLCADPAAFSRAQDEFAMARAQVTDAIATLIAANLLTGSGERFVAAMAAAVDELHTTVVPVATESKARRTVAELRAAWRPVGSAT
jgi:HEXXH motif-containing protein